MAMLVKQVLQNTAVKKSTLLFPTQKLTVIIVKDNLPEYDVTLIPSHAMPVSELQKDDPLPCSALNLSAMATSLQKLIILPCGSQNKKVNYRPCHTIFSLRFNSKSGFSWISVLQVLKYIKIDLFAFKLKFAL